MNNDSNSPEKELPFDRRDFLKSTSFGTLMTMAGGGMLLQPGSAGAQEVVEDTRQTSPPIKCGVIGCGVWGREIIGTLLTLPNAPVTAICDTYGAYLRRAGRMAPDAKRYENYEELIADPEVEAVFVATPTHFHREIVEDAVAANKHVYCEAPIAQTAEDTRAICELASKATRINFQTGLNLRSHPQRHFLVDFIRTGAWGDTAMVRSQYHNKNSWRRTSSSAEQERIINWRLRSETSLGLVGELGIHQLDIGNWFTRQRPTAVTGFGNIVLWKDGRDVDDTIQAIFEYPNDANYIYDATLANSFDGEYEMYYGTSAALMVRDGKAWMFKEVDAPLLGWEVYAFKDKFYKEVGIALVANATKLTAQNENKEEASPYSSTPLFYALEAFIWNSYLTKIAVKDFIDAFGSEDLDALKDYLVEIEEKKLPAAGYLEGFESTMLVIKANEAIRSRSRIELPDEWFELA